MSVLFLRVIQIDQPFSVIKRHKSSNYYLKQLFYQTKHNFRDSSLDSGWSGFFSDIILTCIMVLNKLSSKKSLNRKYEASFLSFMRFISKTISFVWNFSSFLRKFFYRMSFFSLRWVWTSLESTHWKSAASLILTLDLV